MPSLFPKKVHVTEEKVAEELGNLTICGSKTASVKQIRTDMQKPDFLLDGNTRRKTFQELEDRYSITCRTATTQQPTCPTIIAWTNELTRANYAKCIIPLSIGKGGDY